MSQGSQPTRMRPSRNGLTLVEVLVATAISSLVMAGMLTVFLWVGDRASLCVKRAWSQREALLAAEKLTMLIRNASAIVRIDEVEGEWVDLLFTNGVVGRLSYSNAMPTLRAGRMYLTRTNNTEIIVARGLTEIQRAQGYTTPIFTRTRENALHLAFRVSEPSAGGVRDADDDEYAACVSFGVCLRNVEP